MPFAYWLMTECQPKVFVELGTHTGNSYFSFCQAVRDKGLMTRCHAVDTWKGDSQAGFYGDNVFELVNRHNESQYKSFSTLYRMTFDEALAKFDDKLIDLLHIDGFHTYEAVRHDFESWLPKLAPGAIVLFHDIKVTDGEFGVWKFWAELKQKYPQNFEFSHSHGLGVIELPGSAREGDLVWLREGTEEKRNLLELMTANGESWKTKVRNQELERLATISHKKVAQPKAGRPLNLEFFFAQEGEQFSELQKISEPVLCRENEISKIRVQLHGKAARSVLWRTDLGAEARLVQIHQLGFTEKNGKNIWRLTDHADEVVIGGTAERLKDDDFVMFSFGVDPQVILPKLQLLPGQEIYEIQITLEALNTNDYLPFLAGQRHELEAQSRSALAKASAALEQKEKEAAQIKAISDAKDKEIAKATKIGEKIEQIRQEMAADREESKLVVKKVEEERATSEKQNVSLQNTLSQIRQEMAADREESKLVVKKVEEELAQQRKAQQEAVEKSVAEVKKEIVAEIQSLIANLVEQEEKNRFEESARIDSVKEDMEGRIVEVADYAAKIQEAVVSPSSYLIPTPFSWYSFLYKMLSIRKPNWLNKEKESGEAPKRPGFWRRLERSIRKRRKRWIGRIGFDREWYLKEYPDIARAEIDPLEHYIQNGIFEGRWKSEKQKKRHSFKGPFGLLEDTIRKRIKNWTDQFGFDRRWYLKEYPDVKEAGMDPLYHYLEFGIQEGRRKSKWQKKQNSTKVLPKQSKSLNANPRSMPGGGDRGTILIIVHDAELGGAQHLARVFGRWLLQATRYKVKFALVRGGPEVEKFAALAPVINLAAFPCNEKMERLKEFLGEEPRAVLINSVASGACLRDLQFSVPIVAYIHEMSKILELYASEIKVIRDRASLVVAGSKEVAKVLVGEYGFEQRVLRVVNGFIEDDLPPHGGSVLEKQKAKAEIGVDPDSILVTACGVAHWRKSPRTFVEVAARVLARASQKINFIWVGGGEQMVECQNLAQKLGIQREVKFVGHQKNIHQYLEASDIFLLSSEEDPFPLVCLYAGLAANPVICFADAGGTPELVARGGGRIVPHGDISAMADAVLYYVEKPDARLADGKILKNKVIEENTVAAAGPNLFHFIREGAGLRPHISVILPNYNYQRFLAERLDSIRIQSYQDFEVILLDDHSTDNSGKMLKKWATTRADTRLFVNETNSGSPFGQWQKGLSLAEGDLVWIAEADDFCDARFLENLVPEFNDRNVFLAYTKSVPVDSQGAKLGDYDEIYLNRIHSGRWTQDYRATDFEEANKGLGIANCIPNVSSALFRKFQPEPEFASLQKGMQICGDWLFYLRVMRGGLVSYCAKPLNMHRRHQKTVTGGTEGSQKYFSEFSVLREFISGNYRLEESTKNKITEFDQQEAVRFNVAVKKSSSGMACSRARLPSVLFVTSDLSPGGGQMFIIHLANEWALQGGRAILLNAQKYPDHPQVTAKINPRVALFSKAQMTVNELVARFGLEIVHSAIWWADDLVRETIGKVGGVPWVVTMHGCHETLLDHPETDSRFHEKSMEMLGRVDAWVYTAEKNKRLFESHGWPKKTQRIDNGVALEATFGLTRQSIGLSDSALVLCLASRAIFEKGWLEAVAAFKEIHAQGKNVELLLIGEGPAAESVKKALPPGVKLLGQVANLQDYLALADIVLLPSYFVGESLPLVLLEAMALGKPIVATPVGEIPALLGEGRESAGLLVPLVGGRPSIPHLVTAIDKLSDEQVRQVMGKIGLARQAGHYSKKKMLEHYEHLYRDCLSAHRRVA